MSNYNQFAMPSCSTDPKKNEKSGHTPQLEEPKVFDKMLLKWLNTKIN